jgi:MSHA biogenesis protein MshQ
MLRGMTFSNLFCRLILLTCLAALASGAQAVTYANNSIPFSWVNTATHAHVGSGTTPYQFNGTIAPGTACGTTPPTLDDTISDNIPFGFNFNYGGIVFTAARIMSNGRLQFNNNTACGFGSPVQQLPYVYYNSATDNLNYSMRIYGNDLDPTPQADAPYTTACKLTSTCYISYASIGTAPNRQFVVTWNNIPEWAAGGSTTGNYNLQIILNEDGTFIYQYGVDVPGPQAPLAQVGWQVSQTDFDVPSVGLPTNNSAILFYIPNPVAQYHFQQSAWTTPGQVLDTGGGTPVYNGTAKGGATPGAGYICNGAVIPNNTSTATIDAIDTGIPVPSALGSAGTIDFWYKANGAWVGGGDAQLLDATTVNGQWFFAVKRNNGNVRFVITDSTGTLRAAETPANNIAAGTWTHIALTWNFNALAGSNKDHMSVYINGVQTVLSAFTTGGTVSSQIGTLYLGDNRSSFTGSNGTGNSANGTLDEVNIYNFEGGTGLIQRDMNYTASCGPDHLIIQSSGSGLTCAASTLTVVACQDVTCATPYTAGVSGTLGASGPPPTVNWAAGSGFIIPAGSSSVVKNVQVATAGTVTFGVATATPTPTNPTTCNFGNNAPANNNCVFTASTAGFIFSDTSSPGNPYTILPQISGIAATGLYLRAVQVSTTNPAICTPAIISSTTSVNMSYTCNNPTVCQPGSLTTINSTAIAPGGTAVSLTFDANGSAPISVRYDDVGQITLNATKTVTPGGATAITLNGSSNAFIVKPYAFTITNIQRTADGFANPAAASAAGTAFIKAGNSFTATVTATSFSGAATPNFGKETSPEGVLLTPNIVLPVSSIPPALGNGTLAGGLFTSGAATVTNLSWGEVGIITLTPKIASANYLGAGNVTGTTTGNIGRFYPDHFVLTTPSITNRSDLVCGSTFTYMGEPMSVMFKLTAQNTASTTTQNYIGSFAKLDGATASKWTAFGLNDSIGLWAMGSNIGGNPACKAIFSPTSPFTTTLTCPPPATVAASAARVVVSGAPTGTWLAGVGTFSGDTILNRANAVDGYYETLEIGVAPRDADGVQLLGGVLDLDADNSGSAERKNLGNTKMRYGRLRLNNAHGSELLTLPVPLTAQYFNGSGFITNTADNCTAFTLAPASGTAVSYQYGNLLIDNPQQSMTATTSIPTLASPLSAGASVINLPAPSLSGSIDLTLTVPAWLQFNWTGVVGNPKARATFGAYRNTNQFIYQRENY